MGDMKTPDFDDLLAAFDIPDIDAKEAIQSSPEEDEEQKGISGKSRSDGGSPSGFQCSPVSQSNPPVVSVIVKNRIRPESSGELDHSFTNDTKTSIESTDSFLIGGLDSKHEGGFSESLPATQLGQKAHSDPRSGPHKSNGFEGAGMAKAKQQANGDHWSSDSALPTSEENVSGHVQIVSLRHTSDLMSKLNPPFYKQSSNNSENSAVLPPTSASAHFLPLNKNPPPLFKHKLEEKPDNTHESTQASHPTHAGNTEQCLRHIIQSDEDSEPDLGSPLVIHESPELLMASPPKYPQGSVYLKQHCSPENVSGKRPGARLSPLLKSSKSESRPEEPPSTSNTPPLVSQHPQAHLSTDQKGSTVLQEEKYPEHVIDERDSPESPPPDQTGYVIPKSSPSPVQADCGLEPMDSEPSQDTRAGDDNKTEGDQMKVDSEGKMDKDTTADSSTTAIMTTAPPTTTSSPSRPLKVKIKMVKTPTGTITRTVTRPAGKGAGRASSKATTDSTPPPAGLTSKPKMEASQQSLKKTTKGVGESPAVSTLQDASTAMLAAASKVKGSRGLAEPKAKVSAAAVSITKSAALPTISSSPRFRSAGANMRVLGQKTLTSGLAMSTPAALQPPQGSSRPASIVNNTGAIISKSQSNLVEAFNKILNSKNLLPSYKPDFTAPPPAEWGLPLPAQGYRCLECGDAFVLERSLARHYDRRSLRIEVTCNHCAKRLAFFNKCSLLLHAREHKERGLVMQCSHLIMKPVSVEQMVGQPEPAAPVTSSATPPSSSLTPGGSTSSPAALPQPEAPGRRAADLLLLDANTKCPECHAQFCSKEELAAHFQEVKAAFSTACKECTPPILLSNGCNSSAHQRIHKACPPHVCPECGGTASSQATLQTHLEETCLHFTRRIGYRCASCQVVFGGLNSVKSHIQMAHCDIFHKCPNCPMAFKSSPSIQSHITAQHPTLTGGQPKLIYKCVMCDTVFTQKSLLYMHFDTHLTNQTVHVFKCPECPKLYSQRSSLVDHIAASHKVVSAKPEPPPTPAMASHSRASVRTESSDGEDWRDEEEAVNSEQARAATGWSCAHCQTHYPDRDLFIAHMAQQHGKTLKKFPCNKCESSFTTTSSLRRHIRVKHKGLNRGFNCKLCTKGQKTFNSRVMLERHVQLRHSAPAVSQDSSRGASGLDDSSSEQDGGSASVPGRRIPRRAEQEEESVDGASPAKRTRLSVAAPPTLPESGFRCASCGFTTEDQGAFLEHIPQHRTEGPSGVGQQCLQCGACFTSASSLSRHRFITHKVRDAPADSHQVSGERPASVPSPVPGGSHDDPSQQGGMPPLSPASLATMPPGRDGESKLPCRVCGKTFDRASDLNTHFRTHGMAFINAKNAAEKS